MLMGLGSGAAAGKVWDRPVLCSNCPVVPPRGLVTHTLPPAPDHQAEGPGKQVSLSRDVLSQA